MRGMPLEPAPVVAQRATSATWDGPAPAISVLCSTFRRPHYLAELIAALEAQTMATANFEVVIVDNGSSDDTWETLRARIGSTPLRMCVAQVAENKGPASGRNAAAFLARAPLFAFTDDDCLPEPHWVAAMYGALAGGAVVVQGHTEPVPGPTNLWDHTIAVRFETGLFETCNVGYRRDDVLAAGGFRALPGYRGGRGGQPFGGEDTLLGWHIVRATGSPPVFADDALVRHRIEPRTYRGWLHAKSGIWIFVALLAHVPELRRRMFMHWFLNKRTAMFDLGALSVVFAVALRSYVPLVFVVPYLWALLPHQSRGIRRWVRRLPGTVVGDAVVAWSLWQASLRHRRVVL